MCVPKIYGNNLKYKYFKAFCFFCLEIIGFSEDHSVGVPPGEAESTARARREAE